MYESSSDSEDNKHIEKPQVKIKEFIGKKSSERRLIVILERASLETVKV